MKFLVTADNNGAIGRGEQPLVTIPAVQQGFLKETQGKVVVMGLSPIHISEPTRLS